VGHVRSGENSVSALLFYESNGFVSAVNVHVGCNDFCTLFGKFQDSGTANSGSRACDKSDFSRHKTLLPSRQCRSGLRAATTLNKTPVERGGVPAMKKPNQRRSELYK
jgi:hypothetical protein